MVIVFFTVINSKALANCITAEVSVHFYCPDFNDTTDICTTNTQFFNRLFRFKDSAITIPAGLVSWRNHFNDNDLNIPFKFCYGGLKQNSIADIDFFLVHDCLYTNKKLTQFKLINNPNCTFCSNHIETCSHLFIDCSFVQDLLFLVRELCQSILNKLISTDKFHKYVLFGYSSSKDKTRCKLINFILNIYRFTVWSARKWTKNDQVIKIREIFKTFVEKRLEIEFYGYPHADDVQTFFEVFGVGEALVLPSSSGYRLGFS